MGSTVRTENFRFCELADSAGYKPEGCNNHHNLDWAFFHLSQDFFSIISRSFFFASSSAKISLTKAPSIRTKSSFAFDTCRAIWFCFNLRTISEARIALQPRVFQTDFRLHWTKPLHPWLSQGFQTQNAQENQPIISAPLCLSVSQKSWLLDYLCRIDSSNEVALLEIFQV